MAGLPLLRIRFGTSLVSQKRRSASCVSLCDSESGNGVWGLQPACHVAWGLEPVIGKAALYWQFSESPLKRLTSTALATAICTGRQTLIVTTLNSRNNSRISSISSFSSLAGKYTVGAALFGPGKPKKPKSKALE